MNNFVIGVDLGASLIKFMILSEQGEPGSISRVPTLGERGPETVLRQIHSAVDQAKKSLPSGSAVRGIGIGTPGLIDSHGGIVGEAVNIPGWSDVDLGGIIAEREGTEAVVRNDVDLTAFGEYRMGAGKKAENMVCISIGTGVGGGIIIKDKLYTGSYGLAAEIGHMIVEPGGAECMCGQHGCLEQYSSATGLKANCFRLAGKFHSGLAELCAANPGKVTAKTIYDHVRRGDKLALEVHQLSCRMLARAIGIIMTLFTPDLIVMCGGVMKSEDIIMPEILKTLPSCSIPIIAARCDLLAGRLGADAGVIGAAHYALDTFLHKTGENE